MPEHGGTVRAVVLSAGLGTRLEPLSHYLPKALLPIGPSLLLDHHLSNLARHGISEVAINLHSHPGTIAAYVGTGERWSLNVVLSLEAELMGTAGALKRLEWFLDRRFLVVYGDVLCRADCTDLLAFHASRGARATVAVHQVLNPEKKGVVVLDGERIVEFEEKPERPRSTWVNAGFVVFEPQVLELIPPDTFCDIGRDVLPKLACHAYTLRQPLIDIGDWEAYASAQREWDRYLADS